MKTKLVRIAIVAYIVLLAFTVAPVVEARRVCCGFDFYCVFLCEQDYGFGTIHYEHCVLNNCCIAGGC